jgi:hypothetical protein
MTAAKLVRLTTIAFAGLLAMGAASTAFAETAWEASHPRRDQVNDRLENQSRRINREYREGEISRAQAHRLHREDRRIRQEERYMASMNGRHITRAEQRVLNQQENWVSRQIGR